MLLIVAHDVALKAGFQPGGPHRTVPPTVTQQLVFGSARQLIESQRHVLQSPVEPAGGDSRLRIAKTADERTIGHGFARKPTDRMPVYQVSLNALFVQQGGRLQGTLPTSYHRHALAGKLVKRVMIKGVRRDL